MYELAPLPPHTQCPSSSHRRAGCQIQPITFASNPCSSLLDEPDSSLLLFPKSWLLAGTDFSSLHCIYYWGVKHSLQIPSLLACYEEPCSLLKTLDGRWPLLKTGEMLPQVSQDLSCSLFFLPVSGSCYGWFATVRKTAT